MKNLLLLIILFLLSGCANPVAPEATSKAVVTEPAVEWATTPAELREIADRMDTGESITGSGVFGYGADGKIEIYLEGF